MWWIIGIIIVVLAMFIWFSEDLLALLVMILDLFNDWGE